MNMVSRNLARWGVAALALGAAVDAGATVLYSSDFSGASNGNLAGQQGFAQTGSTATNPIQVNSGVVSLGTSGQDVSAPLASSVTTGGTAYISTLVNVSAAQASGDYFVHLANTTAGTLFQDRLFVKSSGTGYVLGLQASSSGVVYGTTVLPFNTATRIVTRYDVVSGDQNDVGYIYVNPTGTDENTNSPYLAATTFAVAENTQTLAAVNLRQGAAGSAPTLTVDDLTVATTFADAVNPGVTVVPEPAGLASLCLISAAGLGRRRRK
jgi:hypothetical protein